MEKEMDAQRSVNKSKEPRGFILAAASIAFGILIPAVTAAAALLFALSRPGFYTGLLKDGRLITALVEAQYRDMDRRIAAEIEEKVKLNEFTAIHERVKAEYESAEAAFASAEKKDEYDSAKSKRKEIKNLSWKQSRDLFKTEDDFDKYRSQELDRIDKEIDAVEDYRDKNDKVITAAKKDFKKAEDKYEDSLDTLEDKKKDAMKIVEKHKTSLAASMYEDLDRLQPALSKIMNRKLIDVSIEPLIARLLDFMTSYDRQLDLKTVAYESVPGAPPKFRIKLPPMSFSLWIDENEHGVQRRRHLLSQIFVEEIEKFDGLKNKRMMLTSFRLSDTMLGEYFTAKVLAKYNVTYNEGVIRADSIVLEGDTARRFEILMVAMTAGVFLPYAALGLVVLYLMILFFSRVNRRKKAGSAVLVMILPSVLALLVCAAAVIAARSLFDFYPEAVSNITARVFAKSFMFSAALEIFIPVAAAFSIILIAGLFIRKRGHR